MNKEQAVKFISEQRWIFAKTYAKTAPDEYIMVFHSKEWLCEKLLQQEIQIHKH